MDPSVDELMTGFEMHSVDRIRAVLDDGFDVSSGINGKTLTNSLIEMYFRSDRFTDCLRLLLQHGAILDDPKLVPVLLNDPDALVAAIRRDSNLINHRTDMVCAFTPLSGASLLHVAAEYGHLQVARKLTELGAEVDARADIDAIGLVGKPHCSTPSTRMRTVQSPLCSFSWKREHELTFCSMALPGAKIASGRRSASM